PHRLGVLRQLISPRRSGISADRRRRWRARYQRSGRTRPAPSGPGLALELSSAVYALWPPSPVRCIIASNVGGATFRFHQIRPGEDWNVSDLDEYLMEKVA